jgi:hypothetical protein
MNHSDRKSTAGNRAATSRHRNSQLYNCWPFWGTSYAPSARACVEGCRIMCLFRHVTLWWGSFSSVRWFYSLCKEFHFWGNSLSIYLYFPACCKLIFSWDRSIFSEAGSFPFKHFLVYCNCFPLSGCFSILREMWVLRYLLFVALTPVFDSFRFLRNAELSRHFCVRLSLFRQLSVFWGGYL